MSLKKASLVSGNGSSHGHVVFFVSFYFFPQLLTFFLFLILLSPNLPFGGHFSAGGVAKKGKTKNNIFCRWVFTVPGRLGEGRGHRIGIIISQPQKNHEGCCCWVGKGVY